MADELEDFIAAGRRLHPREDRRSFARGSEHPHAELPMLAPSTGKFTARAKATPGKATESRNGPARASGCRGSLAGKVVHAGIEIVDGDGHADPIQVDLRSLLQDIEPEASVGLPSVDLHARFPLGHEHEVLNGGEGEIALLLVASIVRLGGL